MVFNHYLILISAAVTEGILLIRSDFKLYFYILTVWCEYIWTIELQTHVNSGKYLDLGFRRHYRSTADEQGEIPVQ